MDKDTFHRLLEKQATGQISPDEEAALKQAYDQLFQEEMEATAENPALGPSDECGEIIRQKIHNRIKNKPELLFNFRSFLKVAAVIFIVGFSSLLCYNYRFEILDSVDPIAEHKLVTGGNAIKMLVLADGSVVWLNTNSSITYPDRFRGKRRNIKLEGTAYFDIAYNKEKPFMVTSGALDVQVLGTTFVVSDKDKIDDKAVTVLTGKVRVDAMQKQIAVLLPNQQIIYDSKKKTSSQRNVKVKEAISFIQNDIDFRDTPLNQILQALQVRFGVQAKYNEEDIRDLHFSGLISKDDTLEDVLDILSSTLNFQYKINHDNTVTITAL